MLTFDSRKKKTQLKHTQGEEYCVYFVQLISAPMYTIFVAVRFRVTFANDAMI